MNYLAKLRQAEPSPLLTLPSYDVTYHFETWHIVSDLDPWSAWFVCICCERLHRRYRVRCTTLDLTSRARVYILHLFFKGLSDRCGECTDKGP